jgi:RHS repeat-associated protein
MLQITDVCPTQYDFMQPTEIGREYRFEADFDVSQASSLFITFLAQSPGCLPPAVYGQNLVVTTGHFSYTFTATTDCSRISIRNYGSSSNGGTFKIDNISFLRGSMNVVTVSNQVGDKQYELANHLGNVLNVVTDRKLRQAPADETVFEDRFNTNGNTLGWHYEPSIVSGNPPNPPAGYSITASGGELTFSPGATSLVMMAKQVYLQEGVSYTLSMDVISVSALATGVCNFRDAAGLFGPSSSFSAPGTFTKTVTGRGANTWIMIAASPANALIRLDNIKLVANDVQTVTADVKTYSDYYPYGMQLPKRHGEDIYRYGYQGSEKDNEVKTGDGDSYTTFFRMLDPRIGRWFSIDPKGTAWESPYVSMGNNPIQFNDPQGDTVELTGASGYKNGSTKGSLYYVNGRVTDSNGDEYTPGVDFSNPDYDRVIGDLEKIRTGGPEGEALIDFFGKDHNIKIDLSGVSAKFNEESNKINYPKNFSKELILYTTENASMPEIRKESVFTDLAHELSHGKRFAQCKTDNTEWVPGSGITRDEIWASHDENKIRNENGLPLRTHYSYFKDTKEPALSIFDEIAVVKTVNYSFMGKVMFPPQKIKEQYDYNSPKENQVINVSLDNEINNLIRAIGTW